MTRTEIALICAVLLVATGAQAAPAGDDVVKVTDYAELAVDVGGEAEDWQPAFQAAAAEAYETGKPLYVPTGRYEIRQAIDLTPPPTERRPFLWQSIKLVGAGQWRSIISQQAEDQNCVDWSGPTYEESTSHGRLEDIALTGGVTVLNIKWHNHFVMDSCYIQGGSQYGVHAEGWSSRFLNSTIRWATVAGIYARAHFNNCVIRDCYFSRNGIGIFFNGGHGNRVEGSGLESCARAAIFTQNTRGLTINNSYFEGNGYRMPDRFPFEGTPNTITIDRNNTSIKIHDNIMRVNRDDEGALISIADLVHGHIYDNLFHNANPAMHGILLRGTAETKPELPTAIRDLIVEHNHAHELIEKPLSEDTPGVFAKAIDEGSEFDMELSP
jgi:hypothetical protein